MKETKRNDFSFTQVGKESIRDRMKALFKGRSLRKVSLDWDIPYSTLNNYFARSATPSVEILVKISEVENVSLTWLATGRNDVFIADEAHRGSSADSPQKGLVEDGMEGITPALTGTPATSIEGAISSAWSLIFDALNPEERHELVQIFFRLGIRGALERLREREETDRAWSDLDVSEKERLIRLHEQMKKGSSEDNSGVAEADLSGKNQKAS
ncbi:helix-turn-helix domain-containing protein [Citrobacter sp. wls718]|uniref:helix-turn-helix domain-containing protein n=1 Tax=Citrobacter sp. wls718 TaxID=2576418 RepID=UPI001485A439|nr:helix-turn-helix domain-containing protein [Citrobacter sp. wls718]